MQRYRKDCVEWLEFDLLRAFPLVKHRVFLRHGGCSSEPFSSLNAGPYVGDLHEDVRANIEKMQTLMDIKMPFRKGRLVHGSVVTVVSSDSPEEIENCDGLMTAEKYLPLMMTHADCQIALFYDPKEHVIANIHCGWKGSVAGIYQKAIEKMEDVFGCRPQNLIACIGPSLGPNHAEFIHYQKELPASFLPFQSSPGHFNFWKIAQQQLMDAGVLPSHIEIAGLCTYECAGDFFSYRREKVTGRHATVISLT